MRVLFWGTPEFATAPLRALLGEGFDVAGVVTNPDKAVGRSRSRLLPPPVKEVAITEGLPVYQPASPRTDDAFIAAVSALELDVSVVVAYGHILPKSIIDLPRRGTLNIHASLLPTLRGAAPIQAAIREGRPETGVTIMRMVPKLDAGPVLLQHRTPILDDETAGELALRLSELGAGALIEALALMEMGAEIPVEQDTAFVTYAQKLTRESAHVEFGASAYEVARHVRAYDPKPGAWGRVRDTEVKLFGARIAPRGTLHMPGEVLSVESSGVLIACGEGAVRISTVQPSGRTRLTPLDWANGRGIAVGDRFDAGASAFT